MNRVSAFVISGIVGVGAMQTAISRVALAEGTAKEAVAHVQAAGTDKEKIKGTVTFSAVEGGVKVVADVEGLTAGQHGFHIHAKADLSDPELKGAGGHWDMGKHKHGGPESSEHHAGDLGNLTADEKGHAHLEEVVKGIEIDGEKGVIGHSVIIHEKADDLAGQPAGNAGKRIAGGAIEAGK